MKEELIRIENGVFQFKNRGYDFDMFVCKGECIGIYADDHLTSGTAYLGIFDGNAAMKDGKLFLCGARSRMIELRQWIRKNCITIDRHRFVSKELTAWDYVIALGSKWNTMLRKGTDRRLYAQESREILQQMKIPFHLERKLYALSTLEYYKLTAYRAWFSQSKVVILDRITEILRGQELAEFMRCIQILQEHGAAILLLDLDDDFMYTYANRIDILKNGRMCYRLRTEEFDERLYEILGWESRNGLFQQEGVITEESGTVVFRVSDLQFENTPPLSFRIKSGEIAFLRDDNYNITSQMKQCLLGETGWESGFFWLNGRYYESYEIPKLLGKQIGLQTEMPDIKSGVLFDNLTVLDNLSTFLIPKAGMHFLRRNIMDSILEESSTWFNRAKLLKPLRDWLLPERLRLSYYKWYALNPSLLICPFPFAGQEPSYHEMIIQMLVTCAQRGMAIWIISSGIDAICKKTKNKDFLQRLRYLDA